MNDDEIFTELTELREVSCPALSVVVDFNDLFDHYGEKDCFSILAKLKDLLV